MESIGNDNYIGKYIRFYKIIQNLKNYIDYLDKN